MNTVVLYTYYMFRIEKKQSLIHEVEHPTEKDKSL